MKMSKKDELSSFNPMGDQINDIIKKVKLDGLDDRANSYAEHMTSWFRDTDISGHWNEEALVSVAAFMKTAFKAGFKEGLK